MDLVKQSRGTGRLGSACADQIIHHLRFMATAGICPRWWAEQTLATQLSSLSSKARKLGDVSGDNCD